MVVTEINIHCGVAVSIIEPPLLFSACIFEPFIGRPTCRGEPCRLYIIIEWLGSVRTIFERLRLGQYNGPGAGEAHLDPLSSSALLRCVKESGDTPERALAHIVANKVESDYHRSDFLEQFLPMMEVRTAHVRGPTD
jgi:hypothetical protein